MNAKNCSYFHCPDINECQRNIAQCDTGSSYCHNTEGSYSCECITGFQKDKDGKCTGKTCEWMRSPSKL